MYTVTLVRKNNGKFIGRSGTSKDCINFISSIENLFVRFEGSTVTSANGNCSSIIVEDLIWFQERWNEKRKLQTHNSWIAATKLLFGSELSNVFLPSFSLSRSFFAFIIFLSFILLVHVGHLHDANFKWKMFVPRTDRNKIVLCPTRNKRKPKQFLFDWIRTVCYTSIYT